MARATGLAGTALLAAALLAWSPQPATGWNQGAAEATLWQLTNGARVNNGLRALQQHSTLVSLARWRSQDSVQRDYFSHTILGTSYQVYHWYDLNGLNYTWGGENIGWNNGYADADSPIKIHEGFMASPGHRANILEPSFTHGGIGAYAADNVMYLGKLRSPRFYTELFMTAAGAAPPPPPPSGGSTPPPPRRAGSGATSRPAPAPTPAAMAVRVDAPAAPQASKPLDGPEVVAMADVSPAPGAVRAMAGEADGAITAAPPLVAESNRVMAAEAPDRGLFETMLGSLLGFFL
ncbi:MAG TPA: CAP domain-containing protein [Candidatus Limnocylindria bacterium]